MTTMRFYRERGGRLECVRVKLWDGGSNALAGMNRRRQASRPNRRQAVELMGRRGFHPKGRFPATARRDAVVGW